MELRCGVQEYFVADMIEVLMYVSRFRPQVLEGIPMEELLLFFVTFMGSPAYIKNPYLRSRMVEVSHANPSNGASCCAQVSWHSCDHAVQGALKSVARVQSGSFLKTSKQCCGNELPLQRTP